MLNRLSKMDEVPMMDTHTWLVQPKSVIRHSPSNIFSSSSISRNIVHAMRYDVLQRPFSLVQ